MKNIKEVEFVNYLRIIEETSATPIICECSDGCNYYTKFYEGNEGPRELVNEFVGFELAKLLRLPIPNAALVRIKTDFQAYIGGSVKTISANNKYAFGSQELTKSNALLDDEFIRKCQNKQDLLPIIVFDHLIGNSDRERNQGNILFRFKDKVIFIIDHGRIFDVGTIWDSYTCNQRKNEEIKIKDLSSESIYGRIIDNVDLREFRDDCVERFSKIKKDDIINIFKEIPIEWDCSEMDREAGIEFIWTRFQKYNYVIEEILKVRR